MSFSFLDIDAANQVTEKRASRHAAVLANTRVDAQFGAFLDASSSPEEREHRMAYIESDARAVIASACEETGHVDVEGVTSAIMDRLAKGAFCDDCRKWGDACTCGSKDTDGPHEDSKDKDKKYDSDAATEEESDLVPGDEDSKESSFREARRPKLCPYHSELTDASLQTGSPQYAAFASLVGTSSHCKGGYDGSCNFKPAMVTQAYWDERKEQYEQNRLERERQQNEPDMTLEQVGPTEIVDAPDEIMDEVDGLSADLQEAPSAVGSGEPVMAASTDTGDSVEKREDLERSEGPVPKIDKTKWKPNALNADGNLPDIDDDSKVHPKQKQDIFEKADHKKDFLEQADSLTKHEDVTQGSEDERNIEQRPTDTWSGTEGQADPVTSNRIRDFFEQGFTPRSEVERMIGEFEARG